VLGRPVPLACRVDHFQHDDGFVIGKFSPPQRPELLIVIHGLATAIAHEGATPWTSSPRRYRSIHHAADLGILLVVNLLDRESPRGWPDHERRHAHAMNGVEMENPSG